MLAFAIALGLTASSAQQIAPASAGEYLPPRVMRPFTSDALTIATWNLQFLPIVGSGCCDHISNRLTKIAAGILAADIDVIAFNEVFTDDAKQKLNDLLADAYPYRVTYIDGDGDKVGLHTAEEAREILRTGVIGEGKQGLTDKQDSGLMLFSQYPFQPFPRSGVALASKDNLKATANGKSWPHVAFNQFGICEGFILPSSGQSTDCMANKGVALVRIAKPGIDAENIYNIAFTHFEAGTDDPELGPLIRDLAIDTPPTAYIKSLLDHAIGDRADEQTIVLGDLNINGAATTDRAEWLAKFTQKGRFFTDVFNDSWDEMRPRSVAIESFDPGLSNRVFDVEQSRLDYILVGKNTLKRWNSQAPCVQHVRVPPSLYLSGAGEELSDHRPVVATLNRPGKYCSPQTGRIIKKNMLDSGPLVIKGKETQVSYPEGAQWYVLASAGTYSIAGWSKKGPVTVDVYSSANMSVPMTAYRSETRDIYYDADRENSSRLQRTAGVYVSPDNPLLIKVSMPNGNTGAYNLGIKMHAGESREDAIVLFPGVVENASWGNNVATPLKRWFRIDTDGPASGEAQSLEFSVIPSKKMRLVSELVKPDGAVVLRSRENTFARSNVDDNFQTYYLVSSPERVDGAVELKVAWNTNLQMIVMQQRTGDTSVLTATNETGWGLLGSDDNVQMKLFADGVELLTSPVSSHESRRLNCPSTADDGVVQFGSFDTGTVVQVDPEIQCSIGFFDSLKVEITEEEWVRNDQLLSGSISGALLLKPNERYRGAQRVMLASGAGEYRLKFYLTRGTQGVARYGDAPVFRRRGTASATCRGY